MEIKKDRIQIDWKKGERTMYIEEQDKKQKQNKAQGLYRRRIKKQNREGENGSKIENTIVSVCAFIMFVILVLNGLFKGI